MSLALSTDDTPRGFVPMRSYLALQRRCEALEEQLALLRDKAPLSADEVMGHPHPKHQREPKPPRQGSQRDQVLRLLTANNGVVTTADVAEALQLPTATVSTRLLSLEGRFIERLSPKGRGKPARWRIINPKEKSHE